MILLLLALTNCVPNDFYGMKIKGCSDTSKCEYTTCVQNMCRTCRSYNVDIDIRSPWDCISTEMGQVCGTRLCNGDTCWLSAEWKSSDKRLHFVKGANDLSFEPIEKIDATKDQIQDLKNSVTEIHKETDAKNNEGDSKTDDSKKNESKDKDGDSNKEKTPDSKNEKTNVSKDNEGKTDATTKSNLPHPETFPVNADIEALVKKLDSGGFRFGISIIFLIFLIHDL